MQEKEADILGVKIHYWEREGTPAPVILLHGFATGGFVWKEVMRHWPVPNRVLAPDLPGNGTSGMPPARFDFAYYVRFLEAFREHLRLERFIGIGHSMGSAILADYSTKYASLDKMILESPPEDRAATPFLWKILSIRHLGDTLLRFYPHNRQALEGRIRRSVAHPEVIPEEYLADSWNAFQAGSLRKWIPQALRMKSAAISWQKVPPCAVVYGIQDFTARNGFIERLKQQMPESNFHEFPDCKHVPHLEHPQRFLELITTETLRHGVKEK